MNSVIDILQHGGVIAYPTEAVYGLGCDPLNESAVKRICELKHRSIEKGLILIASEWKQLQPYVQTIPEENLQKILNTWPGPITWVFPASQLAPPWITGKQNSIAIRVTAHPIARELCIAYDKPIVSTSANREGKEPARDAKTVKEIFGDEIDYIVSGKVGNHAKPTAIYDALTGSTLRSG